LQALFRPFLGAKTAFSDVTDTGAQLTLADNHWCFARANLDPLLPCGWRRFWQFMLNEIELQPISFRVTTPAAEFERLVGDKVETKLRLHDCRDPHPFVSAENPSGKCTVQRRSDSSTCNTIVAVAASWLTGAFTHN